MGRYFIDMRYNGIAVRDSQHPDYNSMYLGFDPNTPDFVQCWKELCDKLNSGVKP